MGVTMYLFIFQKNFNQNACWKATVASFSFKQGVESIEQVAHLCQSETEEVRNAARETMLSFGKYDLKIQILKK